MLDSEGKQSYRKRFRNFLHFGRIYNQIWSYVKLFGNQSGRISLQQYFLLLEN